ncbi:hypothetical protein [Dysgonomonas sp. Marseille-P4361]|uniref:hypothetical protein n=1 Tax=Dysgonomonas sp. Marseille-P4361 TaxID=2161820 RepID=UPI000D553CFA|nr:hypothetical protein [Dysgonomonas sp. Marseille-P4361]
MNKALNAAIDAIGRDIVLLAQEILDDNGLADSRLRDTVSYAVDYGDNVVVRVLMDNYIDFVEAGRAPQKGKKPPISQLEDWAKRRGIPTDNETLYAISEAIWRDGYAAPPILATLEREVEQRFDREWSERLFDALITDLTAYFN